MTSETQIAERDVRKINQPEPPAAETDVTPAVDIYENNDAILLRVDMPGVDQGRVEVTVENNVLTLKGRGQVEPPAGCELQQAEYNVYAYRRDFDLADRIDTAGIKARMRHGVLDVTLPKKQEVKARKIEIAA